RGSIEEKHAHLPRRGAHQSLVVEGPGGLAIDRGDASADTERDCLSPDVLLDRLQAFCERDDYEFLRVETDKGYHDARAFIEQVRQRWLNFVDDELRSSTGLVEESQYLSLFDRYVSHVSHLIKKERVYNELTGRYEEPDEDLMESVETMLGATDAQGFRDELMSRVAAWALDHPDQTVEYVKLFPRYIELLEEAYFEEHKKQIATIGRDVLALIRGDDLEDEARAAAERTYARLQDKHGYAESSAGVAIGALLAARYADV
ncbi:MAG: hypothetical protein AAGE52_19315, partial [Myxococcota bacterium]